VARLRLRQRRERLEAALGGGGKVSRVRLMSGAPAWQ
jgi:hypothetical protein